MLYKKGQLIKQTPSHRNVYYEFDGDIFRIHRVIDDYWYEVDITDYPIAHELMNTKKKLTWKGYRYYYRFSRHDVIGVKSIFIGGE